MKFPLYNLWMDNMFYVYLGALAASLFFLLLSLKRLFSSAARVTEPADFPAMEEPEEPVEIIEERPADPDKTMVVENVEELVAAQQAADPDKTLVIENAEELAATQQTPDPDKTLVVENVEELVAAQQAQEPDSSGAEEIIRLAEAAATESAAPAPAPAAEPRPELEPASPEEMVRGIYGRLSGMDARVRAIEEHIKTGGGRHFSAKFLEGLLDDFDGLSAPKIKARIEYLLSDLKEARERGEKPQGS